MSLARGKYGIEYDPRQLERNGSPGIGWVFVAVAVVASVSLAWTLFARFRSRASADDAESALQAAAESAAPSGETAAAAVADEAAAVSTPVAAVGISGRPAALRNLLMRLEVAERSRDLEMAITTIEQIRSLPGSPAADLDEHLARRLGDLNVRRLFKGRSAQWVKRVKAKGGDSAARIARENGSTFASLALLNEGKNLNDLRAGQELLVMDHPRFRLEVDRSRLSADLFLNGKFFRRYDLVEPAGCPNGEYAMSDSPRSFWRKSGLKFRRMAAAELEQLMPEGSPVVVGSGKDQ